MMKYVAYSNINSIFLICLHLSRKRGSFIRLNLFILAQPNNLNYLSNSVYLDKFTVFTMASSFPLLTPNIVLGLFKKTFMTVRKY